MLSKSASFDHNNNGTIVMGDQSAFSSLRLEDATDHNIAPSISKKRGRREASFEAIEQYKEQIDFDLCCTTLTTTLESFAGGSALGANAVKIPNNPFFAHSDIPLGILQFSASQNTNKKRVTFCKTTKRPSTSITQLPSLDTKNITMKSASCTSLPQLIPSSSCNSLLSESSTVELDLSVGPATFLKTIILQSNSITGLLHGEEIISHVSQMVNCDSDSYFMKYSAEHLDAYTTEKVNAVQVNDIEKLRTLLKSGHTMQASNRFGESMLHTSCRRGYTDMVKFFLHEAQVSPRVRDDMGRNPMHDACWSSAAPNLDMMKILILAAPELLLSKDKRGHSPFDYARREYWPNWISFLNEHRHFIVSSLVTACLESPVPLPDAKLDEVKDGLHLTTWDSILSE